MDRQAVNPSKSETATLCFLRAALFLAAVAPCGLIAQGRYESIAWTPDGKALTVAWRDDSTASDLYVLPLGEGAVRRLTDDPARDAFASWAPDGSAVAFASSRTGRGDIYLAEPDGTNLRRLTYSDSAPPLPPKVNKPNVAILIYDGVQIIDHAVPWEVLGQYSLNNVFTVAKDTTPVTTYMGMRVLPSYGFANHPKPDVIVIPGGNFGSARRDAEIISWIRSNAAASQYVLGICSGVMLLAEAKLLQGRRATTFYNLLDDLRQRDGAITVVEDTLVVEDGKFVTTTGTGIEGALRVLERLHGSGWARVVALNMEFEPLPQEQRTPRAFLADMNLPSSIYAHFPWREAELVRYDGDTSSWSMIWRFRTGETAALAERLRGGLTAEGWNPERSEIVQQSWRSTWALRGRDESSWTASVRLARLPRAGHELTIEVQRAGRK